MQNDLFDVGADLCTPVVAEPPLEAAAGDARPTSTGSRHACDHYNADLPKLDSFVLPGGTAGSALLHVARTVTRTGRALDLGAARGRARGAPTR